MQFCPVLPVLCIFMIQKYLAVVLKKTPVNQHVVIGIAQIQFWCCGAVHVCLERRRCE